MEEKQELVQPSLHRIDEAKLAVCLKTPSEMTYSFFRTFENRIAA